MIAQGVSPLRRRPKGFPIALWKPSGSFFWRCSLSNIGPRLWTRGAYPQSCALRMTAPSAEGAEGFRACRRGAGAFRSPPPPLRAPSYRLVSFLTLAGRGGSVSRRDHNQVRENRPYSQAEPTLRNHTPPNASRSSGEGVWGRGASLREAASPPEFPPSHYTPSSFCCIGACKGWRFANKCP